MVDKIREKDDTWHYLEVNRGRYLCSKHGSFCDSSDNYTRECPICGECKDFLGLNHLDRVLQIIRNIQSRSMKRFYILYGVTGFLGVFSVFQDFDIVTYLLNLCWFSKGVFGLFGLSFVVSFICYLASMAHVKVTDGNSFLGIAKFSEKTITGWEAYMVKHLNRFELAHKVGNVALCLSMGFLIVFLIIQLS